jgi:hypothetical protein
MLLGGNVLIIYELTIQHQDCDTCYPTCPCHVWGSGIDMGSMGYEYRFSGLVWALACFLAPGFGSV